MCVCKGWNETDVRRAARDSGLATEDPTQRLGLTDEDHCGTCLPRLETQLDTIGQIGLENYLGHQIRE